VGRVLCVVVVAAVTLTALSGCWTLGDAGAPTDPSSGAPSGERAIAFPQAREVISPLFGVFSGDSAADLESAVDVIRAAKAANRTALSLVLRPGTETVSLTAGTDIGEGGLVLDRSNSPAELVIDGGGREIRLGSAAHNSLITVGEGVTLTLRNIVLRGGYFFGRNDAPLIRVDQGGRLILESGAAVTDNYVYGSANVPGGGGLYVAGEFVMRDGTISGHTYDASPGSGRGGGVYVSGTGIFAMSGGVISGNYAALSETSYANSRGGAVYVENGGVFTKTGNSVIYGDTDRNHETGGLENTARSGMGNGHAVYYARDNGYYRDDTLRAGEDISVETVPINGAGHNWTKR
jgi:hypothetical protein